LLYHDVKTSFEHCQNTSFYNQGTIQYQSLEELQKHFQGLLNAERAHYELMSREKDELIAALQQIIKQIQKNG